MTKEITPSVAIHKLREIQLELRKIKDQCHVISLNDINLASTAIQDIKEKLFEQIKYDTVILK